MSEIKKISTGANYLRHQSKILSPIAAAASRVYESHFHAYMHLMLCNVLNGRKHMNIYIRVLSTIQ